MASHGDGVKLLESSVYLGPSLYARFPVIRLTIDLGALEQWPTMKLGRGFVDSLLAAVPGLFGVAGAGRPLSRVAPRRGGGPRHRAAGGGAEEAPLPGAGPQGEAPDPPGSRPRAAGDRGDNPQRDPPHRGRDRLRQGGN